MLALLGVSTASAHRPGVSYAHFDGHRFTLVFSRAELGEHFPIRELDQVESLLLESTVERAQIRLDGAPCTIQPLGVREVEADGIELISLVKCATTTGSWSLDAAYLSSFDPAHLHYVEAMSAPVAALTPSRSVVVFDGTPQVGTIGARFVQLGVEHIWTGYDHLAFVLGLVLVTRRLRDAFAIATSFTIAHSVTLTLAAVGAIRLSPDLVELLIAASIVWIGIENLADPPTWRRVPIAFMLGLVHGFGFAGALAEIGIPVQVRTVALVAFNAGVEAGQAVVIACAFPLLQLLRRGPAFRAHGPRALSVLLAFVGLFWLVERLSGSAP